jgi:H+-transporting ATPase
MLLASLADVTLIGGLAASGVLMSALPPAVLAMLLLATLAFAVVMDLLKRHVFSRLEIDRRRP